MSMPPWLRNPVAKSPKAEPTPKPIDINAPNPYAEDEPADEQVMNTPVDIIVPSAERSENPNLPSPVPTPATPVETTECDNEISMGYDAMPTAEKPKKSGKKKHR